MKMTKAVIKFCVNKKPIEFVIVHNLPDTSGLSCTDALQNWLARTDKSKAEDFIEYIRSKNTGYTAVTWAEYEQALNTSMSKNQIGCGYCINESSCKIKDPKINKAKQGCEDWQHWQDSKNKHRTHNIIDEI